VVRERVERFLERFRATAWRGVRDRVETFSETLREAPKTAHGQPLRATLVNTRDDVTETSSGSLDRRCNPFLQAPRDVASSARDGSLQGACGGPVDGAPASLEGLRRDPSTTA
jgi:hypothetical protein